MKKVCFVLMFLMASVFAQSDKLGVWVQPAGGSWVYIPLNLDKATLALNVDPSGAVTLKGQAPQQQPQATLAVAKSGTGAAVGNCSNSLPCNVLIGSKAYQYLNIARITSVTSSAPCTVYVFIDKSNGNRVAGYDSACISALVAADGLIAAPGVKQFPPLTIPLGACSVVSNAINDCMSFVPYAVVADYTVAGSGLSTASNASTGATVFSFSPPQ